MNGGTPSAVDTAQSALSKLLENEGYQAISQADVNTVWKREMGMSIPDTTAGESDPPVDYPKPKDALALGRRLHGDLVCVGRIRWHTKSVWVGLGPKTKAEAYVDCMLIDTHTHEVALEEKAVEADDTKVESGLETAGALLVSMYITVLSGGPKTPHQQKAAINAIALAFDPWLKTQARETKRIE